MHCEELLVRGNQLLEECLRSFHVRRGAMAQGVRYVEVESDYLEAVRMVLGMSEIFMGHALVAEIKGLMMREWHLSVKHILRGCNACVDRMVALDRGRDATSMEYEDPPVELLDLI
ncbi:hypothetical protein V6N13_144553 [Hibiscus sabdariffa]